MQFAILGSGSWATALAKILTANDYLIHWWIRNQETIDYIEKRNHNPHYLSSVSFNTSLLYLNNSIKEVIEESDVIIIAIPSAFVMDVLKELPRQIFKGKKVVSAVKGILLGNNLLNEYLGDNFDVSLNNYFTVLGPCHAEEVASEKLSYLTFSGRDQSMAVKISKCFDTAFIKTGVNDDILGVQYAAVLKNIYAVGAGIAHGLEYGDNFLSVYIANSADEMVGFLQKVVVGYFPNDKINYTASVYLGDLLVTCYSLHSRNRTFGNMLGKGYSVKAAQLELNMVAEGYNACKSIFTLNKSIGATMPVAECIYKILWDHESPAENFKKIEEIII